VKLGDILNSINTGKEPVISRDNEREYVPYIVARCFSNFPDTLFHANELNSRGVTDKKMHYDYLFHSLRKRKRFSPWQKREESKAVEAVAWFYVISSHRAREYITILEDGDIEKILQEYTNAHGA
jgi:hypothetical protein